MDALNDDKCVYDKPFVGSHQSTHTEAFPFKECMCTKSANPMIVVDNRTKGSFQDIPSDTILRPALET